MRSLEEIEYLTLDSYSFCNLTPILKPRKDKYLLFTFSNQTRQILESIRQPNTYVRGSWKCLH